MAPATVAGRESRVEGSPQGDSLLRVFPMGWGRVVHQSRVGCHGGAGALGTRTWLGSAPQALSG